MKVVDQLSEEGVATVLFAGGEPLLSPDFYKIAKYCYEKGIHIGIATNGTLISKKVARKLSEVVDYVQVGIDGSTPEIHDRIRGHGTFNAAMKGLRNLVEQKVVISIGVCANKLNLKDIPKIISLGESLGVNRVLFLDFVPTKKSDKKIELTPVEREHLIKKLYNMAKNTERVSVVLTSPQYVRICLEQFGPPLLMMSHMGSFMMEQKTDARIEGCEAGRILCAIRPDGSITPCFLLPLVVGDLKKTEFKEIWMRSKVLQDLRNRNLLQGACADCEHKLLCGGCRSRAFAHYGNFLAQDPGCIKAHSKLKNDSFPKKPGNSSND